VTIFTRLDGFFGVAESSPGKESKSPATSESNSPERIPAVSPLSFIYLLFSALSRVGQEDKLKTIKDLLFSDDRADVA
jgi:hypothetical protein